MKSADIPEHMRTKMWIESSIRYEKHKGVHTYRNCECGRMACRAVMCVKCWEDVLKEKSKL